MFAQIYGQQGIIDLLEHDILQDELPQALLFSGERYTGRMTAALETARVLHCTEGGLPGCRCRRCRDARYLTDPFTMIYANREFLTLFDAAAASYSRSRNEAARELVSRGVNLLIKRFDVMWIPSRESFEKQYGSVLGTLQEHMELFLSGDDRKTERQDKHLAAIRKQMVKLTAGIKSSNIPIEAIRTLQHWLATKPGDRRAAVIIEGVEHFGEASKNALLKFLEEPPRGVTVMLLTEGRGRIIPTILSRVRTYPFTLRSNEDQELVIRDVYFQDPDDYDSLSTFFSTLGGIDCRTLREDVQHLTESLLEPREYDHERSGEFFQRIDDQQLLEHVLRECTQVFQEYREASRITSVQEERLWEVLSRAWARQAGAHQRESLVMEACFYRMADIMAETGN